MLADEVMEQTRLEKAEGVLVWWAAPQKVLVSDLPVNTPGSITLQPH